MDKKPGLEESFADDEQTDVGRTPSKPKCSLQISDKAVTSTPPNVKSSDMSPPDTNSEKKRRIRRKNKGGKHHRKCKWKPYSKMSWDERKTLEEKESKKAALKREERFASGQPMAPYNTTQFLMDIHDPDNSIPSKQQNSGEDQGHAHNNSHDGSGSIGSSDEYYSSPDDEEIFLEKEFSVDYENYHAEHIRSLSKEDLVKEYIEMEMKIEKLTKQLKEHESIQDSTERNNIKGVIVKHTMDTTQSSVPSNNGMTELLKKIHQENEQLRKENERLRHVLLKNENKENKDIQT